MMTATTPFSTADGTASILHSQPFTAGDWSELDAFEQGYVEAIFFTECHSDNPDLEHLTYSDLSAQALKAIQNDCVSFRYNAAKLLNQRPGTYTLYQAGIDFWLTRNGHGAGFWDRGLGDLGDRLSDAAERFGPAHVWFDHGPSTLEYEPEK